MNPYFALFFNTLGPAFFSALVSMVQQIHPAGTTGSVKLDHALQVTAALASAVPQLAADINAVKAAATPLIEHAVSGMKAIQSLQDNNQA